MRRGMQEQESAGDSADCAYGSESEKYPALHIKVVSEGAAAECESCPQGDRIRGIGGNRGNSGEQECRKSNETATARDRIERAPESGGKK